MKTLICVTRKAASPSVVMLRARWSAQHVVAVLVLGSMRRRRRNGQDESVVEAAAESLSFTQRSTTDYTLSHNLSDRPRAAGHTERDLSDDLFLAALSDTKIHDPKTYIFLKYSFIFGVVIRNL